MADTTEGKGGLQRDRKRNPEQAGDSNSLTHNLRGDGTSKNSKLTLKTNQPL